MSYSGQKTLADDFVERLSKTFRPEFIKNVDNPSLLVDYLECLEPIDEEMVKAKQTEKGAIAAASELYDRLVRRPDWIDDLSRALMDEGIGLDFLADKLKRFELIVPARFDISSFQDFCGRACFNGHCSDNESEDTLPKQPDTTPDYSKETPVKHPSNSDNISGCLKETTSVKQPRSSNTILGCSEEATVEQPGSTDTILGCSEETPVEQPCSSDTILASSEETPVKQPGSSNSIPSCSEQTAVKRPWSSDTFPGSDIAQGQALAKETKIQQKEDLRLLRERLRLKFLAKLFSFLKEPKDVPVVICCMDKINTQLDRIDCGSIIFSFYIDSLEALQAFEKMWRNGGLKKLIDKDVLNNSMMKELKAIGENAGHHVDDIKSEVNVFETDIERCRARLLKTHFDILPFNIPNTSFLINNKPKRVTLTTREVAHFAFDRLPELRALIEDPLVSDKIEHFYALKSLFDAKKKKSGSISKLFSEWLNDQLSGYLKGLDSDTRSHILCLAVYLVRKVESGEPATIPSQPFSGSTPALETVYFPTDSYDKTFWFECVQQPGQLNIDGESLLNACKELSEKCLICRNKNELSFPSALLRDMFVTKVILCSRFKGSMKFLTESFDYVQILISMYRGEIRKYISHQAEEEFKECSFKHGTVRFVYESERRFYRWHAIRENMTVERKTKRLTVNLSKSIENSPDCLPDALDDLIAMKQMLKTQKYSCIENLNINNFNMTSRDIENIGLYLNVEPNAYSVSMENCQLCTESLTSLTQVLRTGHFRNIRKLNIADNKMQLSKTQPLGLMHMQWLESLQIQNCNLGDEGIRVLAWDLKEMANLRDINVANNLMSSKGLLQLVKAFATNKRLTTIRIHRNYIGEEGSVILAGFLEDLILLEVLNISECGIGNNGSAMVAKSLVSRSLRKLSLRKNDLTAMGSRAFFKTFRRPPYFEHLDFSQNCLLEPSDKISTEAALDPSMRNFVEPFVEFLQQPIPLIHLSLWNTNIGEKRLFRGLQDYSSFHEIRYLCLQENSLTDDFVQDLTECLMHGFSYLQHFNLRQNRIGTSGAKHIARALSAQRYLQEVLLDRNEIGDKGAKQIVESCARLPAIELINLSYNNISHTMMETIGKELEEITQNARKEVQIDDGSSSSRQENISVQDNIEDIFKLLEFEYNTNVLEETPYRRSEVTRVTKIKTEESLDENIFTIERKEDTFYITM